VERFAEENTESGNRTPAEAGRAVVCEVAEAGLEPLAFRRLALLIGAGWLATNLAAGTADLPLRFLLKDRLHLEPRDVALFFAVGNIANYVKPLAGVLCDSVPCFGTRRYHYLLFGLFGGGALWLLLGLVPYAFAVLLATFFALNTLLMLTSTSLGGLMVEVGKRFEATGRLSAQRIGIVRSVSLVTGPLGGFLSTRAFGWTTAISAALHGLIGLLFWRHLQEPQTARADESALRAVRQQGRTLLQSRTLWSAAGLVVLVIASPGFGTPLFYYQTDVLHFTPQFIGNLAMVGGGAGFLAAWGYSRACRRLTLRQSLAASITIHVLGTLCFLAYASPLTAILITGVNGAAGTLAVLPLYDLAARATPRGSEAIGYSVMMSMWNLTNALSDWSGSWLYSRFHLTFIHLVWINAGTTALVLFALPLLPAVLMSQKDGAI
jgi:MFS family permease